MVFFFFVITLEPGMSVWFAPVQYTGTSLSFPDRRGTPVLAAFRDVCVRVVLFIPSIIFKPEISKEDTQSFRIEMSVWCAPVSRDTWLIRKHLLLGPYSRLMPRALVGFLGGRAFSYERSTPVLLNPWSRTHNAG